MAIQTQRFTPIKASHYTLAETQDEKREEMKRDMQKTQARQAGLMRLQQQRQAGDSVRQDKSLKATAAQNSVTNKANQRISDRADEKIVLDKEKTAYDREQSSLVQTKLDQEVLRRKEQEDYDRGESKLDREESKLDREESSLAQQKLDKINDKNAEISDYNFKRKQEEDARKDTKTAHKERMLSIGSLGSFIDRMTNEGNVDENGLIDISEMKGALPPIIAGYEFRGAPKVLVGADNYVTFYDDGGPIKNNGKPARIHKSMFDSAALFADDERFNNMSKEVKAGNKKARSDARKEYEYNRGMVDKLTTDYNKFLQENEMPELPEDASSEDEIYYNAQREIHQKMIDRITKFKDDANEFLTLSESTMDKTKYNISRTMPKIGPQDKNKSLSDAYHDKQKKESDIKNVKDKAKRRQMFEDRARELGVDDIDGFLELSEKDKVELLQYIADKK